ncbi:MAG: MATE family efflux transporter [Pseudomonadota bacterium]
MLIRQHMRELLRLATPVMISRAGILTMVLIDTVMVGRFSADELAYQAIGWAPVVVLTTTGVGLVLGTLVITANALGRGEQQIIGITWRRGVATAMAVGLIAAIACQFGPGFLSLTGQSAELSREGGAVVQVLGLSLPATFIYVVTSFTLEGLKRPVPAMWIMLAANILNVGLNWALIYGHMGLPPMGATGAAWATVILRCLQAAALIAVLLAMRDARAYGFNGTGWGLGPWRDWAKQRAIGYASAISIMAESVSFAVLAIMAGWLGNAPLAAYNIAHNVLATMFMVALGLGSATAVRVGYAYGQTDYPNLARAGWTGLGLNTGLMFGFGIALWLTADLMVLGFTDDPSVLPLAAAALAIVPWLLIVDGGQVVMANAARGRQDVWIPTVIQFVAYCLIMVPAGYWLGIHEAWGVDGLFYAILLGSGVAVILQCVRFAWLGWQDQRQVVVSPS